MGGEELEDGRMERGQMMEGWTGVGGWKDGEGLENGRMESLDDGIMEKG